MMRRSRRIPFNPSDYFFYSHDRMMRRRGDGANIAGMTLELDGDIDPARLRQAVERTYRAFPVLIAGIRHSLLSGRPYWQAPADIERAAVEQSAVACRFEDVSNAADGAARAEDLWQHRLGTAWDLRQGPQMRLDVYALPEKKTRVCIYWPHLLMDAEGAMLFLAHLSRQSERVEAPIAPRGDVPLIDPLAEHGFVARARLAAQGLRNQSEKPSGTVRTLFGAARPNYVDQRCLHRTWGGESFDRLRQRAKDCVPSGPSPYARYLAACTIRALHRIFTDRGIESDAYLITMPHSLSTGFDKTDAMRPLQGNYLVSPTLYGLRSLVGDKRALAADLTRQLDAYRAADMPRKQWAITWAASFARAGFYQVLMRLPLGLEALSSGFSYYGEIREPIASLCGATVRNLWGYGPLPTPPAWNPTFSRFGDFLNLSLTYSRPAIADDLAQSFIRYIEDEMLDCD